MTTLWQDIRFGLRVLLKSPGFTLVAVAALALGIGANTAIFSVVNAVLLRPLPFADAERLVWLQAHNPPRGITNSNVSGADFAHWREQGEVFDGAAVFTTGGAVVTGGDEPERVPGAGVSAGFFDLFGARPAHGRTFTPEETAPGGEPAVVLSHGLWRRRFGGDASVVGSRQLISGRPTHVVGVMPEGFEFPQGTQIWSSMSVDLSKERRDNRYLQSVARLRPGVSLEQAQAQLNLFSRQLAAQYVETNDGWEVRATGLQEQLTAGVRPALLLLLGAVAFVLLITCANVANLLLARAARRRREIAVRTALGASRLRILRQLLTESLLLSAAGGAAGLILSVWLTDLLVALSPAGAPRIGEVATDWRVLSFTVGVTLFVGLLFGLAPALQTSRLDLSESLKEGGRGGEGPRQSRLRSALVVSEVALSLVLLAGAGLLVQSLSRLQRVEPGFDASNVLTLRVALPGAKYQEKARKAEFFRSLSEQAGRLPGVESAGATLSLPLNGSNYLVGRPFVREGRPQTPEHEVNSAYAVTAGEYFRAMRIPLIRGRFFDARDTADSPPVIIINEAAARRAFPDEDPVGQRIRLYRDSTTASEIVGVVGDVRPQTLEQPAGPQVYVPHAQDAGWGGLSLAVRTTGAAEPESLASSVRGVVRALDPDQPVFDVRTAEEVVANSVATRRVSATLLAVFAGLAALLAGLGIYGVIAYAVAQRTHEIGVRMALGARRGDIMRLVLRQGMTLAALGVLAGLALALAATRVISGMLYGVTAADPLTFAAVALLLAAVALLACLVPARRATRVDPMEALRYE